jgi:hypothetical protein
MNFEYSLEKEKKCLKIIKAKGCYFIENDNCDTCCFSGVCNNKTRSYLIALGYLAYYGKVPNQFKCGEHVLVKPTPQSIPLKGVMGAFVKEQGFFISEIEHSSPWTPKNGEPVLFKHENIMAVGVYNNDTIFFGDENIPFNPKETVSYSENLVNSPWVEND